MLYCTSFSARSFASRFLFIERVLQEFDVAARGVVFLFHAFNHVLSRSGQVVIHFFLLRGEPQNFRKIRPVLVQRFRISSSRSDFRLSRL